MKVIYLFAGADRRADVRGCLVDIVENWNGGQEVAGKVEVAFQEVNIIGDDGHDIRGAFISMKEVGRWVCCAWPGAAAASLCSCVAPTLVVRSAPTAKERSHRAL